MGHVQLPVLFGTFTQIFTKIDDTLSRKLFSSKSHHHVSQDSLKLVTVLPNDIYQNFQLCKVDHKLECHHTGVAAVGFSGRRRRGRGRGFGRAFAG